MLTPTGYHEATLSLTSDLVNHGWGELTFKVSSLKDNSVKIEILCGKSYVYFIKKDFKKFDPDTIL